MTTESWVDNSTYHDLPVAQSLLKSMPITMTENEFCSELYQTQELPSFLTLDDY